MAVDPRRLLPAEHARLTRRPHAVQQPPHRGGGGRATLWTHPRLKPAATPDLCFEAAQGIARDRSTLVVVARRDPDPRGRVVERLRAVSGNAVPRPLDLAIQASAAGSSSAFGKLDRHRVRRSSALREGRTSSREPHGRREIELSSLGTPLRSRQPSPRWPHWTTARCGKEPGATCRWLRTPRSKSTRGSPRERCSARSARPPSRP